MPVEGRHTRLVCEQMHIRRRNLSVCIAADMVETKCPKCSYIAKSSWAWQQHLNRSTPCDAGTFECRLGCGKPLKSADTRCRHEKTCQGPQRTREEVEAGAEEAQAKLASREETSKLDLALISQASTSVVQKLVFGIQSNPEMVLDVNKLKLHHAIGKEATRHLRGRNIGLKLSANPGANTLVNWFWLLRDQTLPENLNIMLLYGNPPYAVIRYEDQWETRNVEEALLTVFNSDAMKLYVFLDSEANLASDNDRDRVSNFRLKFVLHKVMAEALSDGVNSELFCHWKQGVAEQLHKVTLELYAEKATKSFASAADHSRQETLASNLQEIKRTREMIRELQHKEEVLMEENMLLFKPQRDLS